MAILFAMAQQNSIKLGCQLTFKQNLYVYLIISYYLYINIFRSQTFSVKIDMQSSITNTILYYKYFVYHSLIFLPFWNLVSIFFYI